MEPRGAKQSAMRILFLASCAWVAPAWAQPASAHPQISAEEAEFVDSARAASAALDQDGGALWGKPPEAPAWMGVEGKRILLTQDPHLAGYLPIADGMWGGPLPVGMTVANTSQTWAGRRWAMVMLPLGGTPHGQVRLLIHEVCHTLQPALLPAPVGKDVDAELLDRPEGRLWLALELRALGHALEATSARDRRSALADALVFRARRYLEATADERGREQALDVSEGMPEYTAWKLTRATPAELAAFIAAEAPRKPSWVRSFPYLTGPAYGELLDAVGPKGWRAQLRGRPDLQQLAAGRVAPELSPLLGGSPASPAAGARLRHRAESLGRRYGLEDVRQAEQTRWQTQQRELASLRARFVDGPTLRVPVMGYSISFNPNGEVPLGTAGTVKANVEWKGPAGAQLTAPSGALMLPDWSELRVPLAPGASFPEGVLAQPRSWTGPEGGWTLTLPAGWHAERAGNSWRLAPPASVQGH